MVEPLLRSVHGEALRRARRRQGRTLDEVAGSAGISTQYLSEIERGRKEPSSEILAAVCRALGWNLLTLTVAAQRRYLELGHIAQNPETPTALGVLPGPLQTPVRETAHSPVEYQLRAA